MNTSVIHPKQNLQAKLEDVLTSMPVAISWATIGDGNIQFVNRKFTALFGYELEDLSTVTEWIKNSYVVPEQAEKISKFWLSQHDFSELPRAGIEEVELIIRCNDGSVKTVLSSKILLPEEQWALATFVDITMLKEEETLIKQQALEDPLTGLLNRRAFSQLLNGRMARISGDYQTLTLLLLDLDGFKQINDSLGHENGDLLLKHVADRMRFATRNSDSICRIGGDEFCVVVDNSEVSDSGERVAERIIREIAKPFHLQNLVVSMSISVGIAVYPTDAGDDVNLFRAADRALYRAKHAGRGVWSR